MDVILDMSLKNVNIAQNEKKWMASKEHTVTINLGKVEENPNVPAHTLWTIPIIIISGSILEYRH